MRPSNLLFILLLFSFQSSQKTTKINVDNFDFAYLESLVNDKINALRLEKKVQPLEKNSILYLSAAEHCAYMVKTGRLSHYESGDKSMQTPQKRAEKNGLKGYWVGENVLFTFFNSNVIGRKNTEFKTHTYEVLAEAVMHSWVTSPGHYANMIEANYSVSGLAVGVDFETKKVFVCQDFGKLKSLYN